MSNGYMPVLRLWVRKKMDKKEPKEFRDEKAIQISVCNLTICGTKQTSHELNAQ
jgi:hypothetical protein